jgi:hypothetical protein
MSVVAPLRSRAVALAGFGLDSLRTEGRVAMINAILASAVLAGARGPPRSGRGDPGQ